VRSCPRSQCTPDALPDEESIGDPCPLPLQIRLTTTETSCLTSLLGKVVWDHAAQKKCSRPVGQYNPLLQGL